MAASSSSSSSAPAGPTAEDICRICFLTSDECSDEGTTTSPDQYKLISPCKCVGSQKYVHLGCLRKWQRTIQLNGPNHPEDRMTENRHMVCNVCKTPFDLEPQDRATMMAEFAGVVPEEISPGLLLVTKKAGSQAAQGTNLDLGLRAFLESKAAHFREAVYILTDVFPNRSGTGDGSDVVLGVNLSRRLEVSPDVSCLKGAVSIVTLRRYAQQGISVLWMNGGPVEPRSVTAMCVAEQLSVSKKEDLLSKIPNITELRVGTSTDTPASSTIQASAIFCGSLEGILSMAAETSRGRKGVCSGIVLAWAGFAQWSRAQLLGEMARGSWGWCRGSFTDVTTATAVAAGMDDEPRDTLRDSLPQRSHFIWGRSHPNESSSSSSSSPNSAHGRNRSSSPSSARRAHYKEPLWNVLRPSDRLSWAPDNEVARNFESRLAQSWHGPAVTSTAQQVHSARLIVQQFEAILRNPDMDTSTVANVFGRLENGRPLSLALAPPSRARGSQEESVSPHPQLPHADGLVAPGVVQSNARAHSYQHNGPPRLRGEGSRVFDEDTDRVEAHLPAGPQQRCLACAIQ